MCRSRATIKNERIREQRADFGILSPIPQILLIFSLLSFSCQSIDGKFYPISQQTAVKKQNTTTSKPTSYKVQKNDTLYSIAFRFELDYRKLANANSIQAPYVIFPGQTLKLVEKNSASRPSNASQSNAKPSPTNHSSKNNNKQQASKKSQNNVTTPTVTNPKKSAIANWYWPTTSTKVRTVNKNTSLSKGIDITGTKGDSVNVTAAGTVVFAGTGPLGYGQLLIVQHNEDWLSAYSNIENISVKEQQVVKARAKIAEIGHDRSGNSILHFEIRHKGKPVDPLNYLKK